MPVETLSEAFSETDSVFRTVAPKGNVSVWCVHNGGQSDGFPSAAAVKEHGIPFGHGSDKVIKGFKTAQAPDGNGKGKDNIIEGPSGRKYVELYVPEDDFKQKQKFEASLSNQAVLNAQQDIKRGSDQDGIRRTATAIQDRTELEQLKQVAS